MCVLNSVPFLYRAVPIYDKVPCLWRFPQFRGVLKKGDNYTVDLRLILICLRLTNTESVVIIWSVC